MTLLSELFLREIYSFFNDIIITFYPPIILPFHLRKIKPSLFSCDHRVEELGVYFPFYKLFNAWLLLPKRFFCFESSDEVNIVFVKSRSVGLIIVRNDLVFKFRDLVFQWFSSIKDIFKVFFDQSECILQVFLSFT